MSTEIIVNNDIIEINVCEEPIIIEAPSGAYPLPSGVYSVYGRTGNVVAEDGDYNLTQLGDVIITNPATGQVLRFNGTTWENSTESYVGTVTSVAATVPTGLTISGSPITTSGTLAIGLESGYSIPQTTNQSNWDTAYNRSLTSAAVTGTTTKTLTLNEQGGGTITASWTDINTDAVTSVFGRTGAVTAESGDYTTLLVPENTNLYFTNQRARYAISGDSNSGVVYSNTTGIIALDDIPNTSLLHDSVTINGKTVALGASTTLTTTDVAEGTNLYFTTARAQDAISGTAPISVSSGVVSISQSGPSTNGYLSSADWNTFNGKQSALTLGNLTSSDITVTGGTGAVVGSGSTLTLANVNSNVGSYGDSVNVPTVTVNAKGLVTSASQTAIPTASNTTTGLLTSSDWGTFNAKQAALNGTGFVKVSGTTVSYDNSTYLTTIEGISAGGELSGTYASPSLVNSAVTGKVLTGVNITGGTIQATDSILTAFGKVQNQINGLIGGSIYKGTWNASTNTPALASGVGTTGWYYIVNVAGSTNLDGITDWSVGDWAIFDGTAWQQVDNTDAVVSVNGFTGAVSLTTSNISEGTNLYYTDARARGSVSAGTGISYNSTTGVITNSAPDQTVSLTGAGTTSISGTYPNFTITSNDQYLGTVTSVGLTSSAAALTISNSPITSNGNIGVNFAGTSAQYVAGDGSLVTFPSIVSQAENLVTEVYNETGATLTKGTIVYINGGHGNLPTVTKALASADSTSAQTYGWVNADITNNNNGYVTAFGSLENIDTQTYAAGTQLYLSGTTAGAYTSTKPYAPIHLVYVGVVTRSHPTQGVIEVRIQNGYELDELHNVSAQTPSNGDILQYVSSTSLWTSVAGSTSNISEGSNLYFTNARARSAISLTTTGSSGASTYNSTTGVLNVPTYTLAGLGGINLTSLSATSPLLYDNTTGVFSIQQASGSQAGYLSSADWTTFNNKVSSATLAGYLPLTGGTLTGDLRISSSTSSNIYLGSSSGDNLPKNINWMYHNGQTNSRSWRLTNDSTAYGDFAIQQSTTQTGTTFASKLYISPAGNVGIGRTSASEILSINNPATSVGGVYPIIVSEAGTVLGGVYSSYESSSPVGAGLAFKVYKQNVGLTETARFTNSGDVLIGLTSSTYQTTNRTAVVANGASTALFGLVVGGVNKGYFYSTGTNIHLMSEDASGYMSFGTANTEKMRIAYNGRVSITGANNIGTVLSWTDAVNNTGYLNIRASAASIGADNNFLIETAGSERMRITSGGDLQFGNGNSVKQTINSISGSYGQFQIGNPTSNSEASMSFISGMTAFGTSPTSVNGDNYIFGVGAGIYGIGGNSWGIGNKGFGNYIAKIAYNSTSWTFSSDIRLKNIISNVDDALDKVCELNPVYYHWKSDEYKTKKVGLIAQEVYKLFPDIVDVPKNEFDDNGNQTYWGLNYGDLTPILIKAIQELKAEIDLLKAK